MSLRKLRGFTLLELIVVIVILGLLAVMAIPTFKNVISKSALKTAEVTASAVAREAIALRAMNDRETFIAEDLQAVANDLGVKQQTISADAGVYADASSPYVVVTGNWEFSGSERTISVKLASPEGEVLASDNSNAKRLGVAIWVPNHGCAFAKTEGTSVSSWSIVGVEATSCMGALAFADPDDVKKFSAPPAPAGLTLSAGKCSDGEDGVNAEWSNGYADIYVNGKWIGAYLKNHCLSGVSLGDNIVVVPRDSAGSTPAGWEKGAGNVGTTLDNGEIITLPGVEPSPQPTSTPAPTPTPTPTGPSLEGATKPIVWPSGKTGKIELTWEAPEVPADATQVQVEVLNPETNKWEAVAVVPKSNGKTYYDGGSDLVFRALPWKNGSSYGKPIPLTARPVYTPSDVIGQEGASGPAIESVGNSITIRWGAVADTTDAPLGGYHVYRAGSTSEVAASSNFYRNVGKDTTMFRDSNLTPGVYCYSLTAYGDGGESSKSGAVCASIVNDYTGSTPFTASQVTTTSSNTCALNTDGALYCWGTFNYGQAGSLTRANYLKPTRVGAEIGTIKSYDASDTRVCVINTNDQLYCWGAGKYGEIGDGGTSDRANPVEVTAVGAVKNVSLGSSHTCAVKTNGELYCWGYNASGQIGNGLSSTTPVKTPYKVGVSEVNAVYTGLSNNTCSFSETKGVYCWGSNNYGQVTGTITGNDAKSPTAIRTAAGWKVAVSSGSTYLQGPNGSLYVRGVGGGTGGRETSVEASGVAQIKAGSGGYCITRTNGSVNCSAAELTQLNDSSHISVHNRYRICGIKPDSVLWCYGTNSYGELGIGVASAGNDNYGYVRY